MNTDQTTQPAPKISEPLVIQIRNTSNEKKEFFLFGFNKFNKKENFGNDKEIIIKSLTGCDYDEYFNNSAGNRMVIGKWRFQSSNTKMLQKTIYHHMYNVEESYYLRRSIKLSIMRDAYQQQSDILDVSKQIEIFNNTYFSGEIPAETTLVICLFPVSIFTPDFNTQLTAERLSGKNLAPVIIQTVQSSDGTIHGKISSATKAAATNIPNKKKASVSPAKAKAKSQSK